MSRGRVVFRSGAGAGIAALLLFASASGASAYISNRLFFQSERAKADRRQGFAAPQQGTTALESRSAPYRVTRSGVPLKVHSYYSVTPTCASQGFTAVNVVGAPQGGQVFMRPGREYPSFPTTNTHAVCNSRRVSTTDMFYRSAAGYVGTDRFTVEVVFPTGIARQETYVVSVR